MKSVLTLLLLASWVLISPLQIRIVKAENNIYIRTDGSVEGTDKIQRYGDMYIFTGDIEGSVVMERDGIVLDGGGYTLRGTGSGKGVDLSGIRKNVTVQNCNIKKFHAGIYIGGPYTGAYGEEGGNTIAGNNVTNNTYGIWLKNSPDNVFENNTLTDNEYNIVFNPTTRLFYTRQKIEASNSVNGKPVYYWVEEENRTVPLDAGYVALIDCKNTTVQNLNLSKNGDGLLLFRTTDSTIANNTLMSNKVGIQLSESSSNTILGNHLTKNGYGIQFLASPNNTLRNNRMCDNQQNLIVDFAGAFTQDIDSTNSVNGKPVYYWVEQKGKTVPLDAGYVALIKCTNITVHNLRLTDREWNGINLVSTTNSKITQNTIKNKEMGIYLRASSNNTISDNVIANNGRGISLNGVWPYPPNNNEIYRNIIRNNGRGIWIFNSPDNWIYDNNITNNGDGIYISPGEGSKNNTFYSNNFINNTAKAPGMWQIVGISHEVYTPPLPNAWDYDKKGNYWSDYTTRYPNATIINGSQWSVPYNISENNQDNYPLIEPVDTEASTKTPSFPVSWVLTVLVVTVIVTVVWWGYQRTVEEEL
ncbi:MAG: right-handed parallel beta-helix repeat-containing protein [Thermoproteota archaeon]